MLPTPTDIENKVGRSKHPALAAAASWMEQLHKPMREIQKQFTKSELFIMGWRSAELSANMHSDHVEARSHIPEPNDALKRAETSMRKGSSDVSDRAMEQELEEIGEKLGPEIVQKCEDENGNLDLRRLTGPEVAKFLAITGIGLGRM